MSYDDFTAVKRMNKTAAKDLSVNRPLSPPRSLTEELVARLTEIGRAHV